MMAFAFRPEVLSSFDDGLPGKPEVPARDSQQYIREKRHYAGVIDCRVFSELCLERNYIVYKKSKRLL